MARISVLTPTHNRKDLLVRLYKSLELSTYRDFEWTIIDDGSEDGTKEVIDEVIKMSSFPIHYYWQENTGKTKVMDRLYQKAEGEYCFLIDDDDELLPDAMEKALAIWDSFDTEQRERTWCVCGRCINSETKKMVGNPFPDNINELSSKKKKNALKMCGGEKISMQKLSIMKQHRFPEIEGCNFIFEKFLWDEIDSLYEQYYTNDIFRVYYVPVVGGGSLSNRKFDRSVKRALSDYNLHKYILEKCPNKYPYLSRDYLRSIVYINTSAKLAGKKKSEMVSGMKIREKLTVLLASIPLALKK